jgi:hypothetical protein
MFDGFHESGHSQTRCRQDNGTYQSSPLLMEIAMGRGILLWLLGVPIPIIILLALIWR